jgi:hypothetical protein
VKARLAGALVGTAILAVAVLIAGVVYAYLAEYGGQRIAAVAAIVAAGIGLVLVAYWATIKYCRNTRRTVTALLLLAVVIGRPILSTIYPGQVTYARFGLTVIGAVPVPLLDITAGPRGGLWFRDKSHFVSLEFALYNNYRSQGRRVVLLAHSTC